MGLYISGDGSFQQSGPPQWRRSLWELDQLMIPYRGSIDLLDTFLNAHSVGEESPIDASMLLTQMTPDNHPQFPTVELVYLGRKNGNLPPQRHDTEDSVGSASSMRSATQTLTTPTTVQFYAPSSVLSYISQDSPGTDIAPDPAGDPRIISLTINDTSYTPTTFSVPFIVSTFFQIQVINSFKSTELVPGRYFLNVSKRIKSYTAQIFDIPPGGYAILVNGGVGYSIGPPPDILTINGGGGSGQVSVASVYVGGPTLNGTIAAVLQLSNSFTTPATDIAATGGSGHGARFDIWIL
jgi:hypothetical protein